MQNKVININPSLTQGAFIESLADENLLVGPRGEGKSTAGVIAMTHHAQQQPAESKPIQWFIIRDTFENLRNTTLKAIMMSPLGPAIVMSEGGKKITMPGEWEAALFGVDSMGDISKLQGAELGGLWFEECAPAAEEDIGSGIQDDAYTIGLTSLRQKGVHCRAQITQNYPDEDHWTWQRFVEKPEEGTACFRIPRFENPFIEDGARKKWERQLANRPDLAKRLVLGEPGYVQKGVGVTPEFVRDQHVAPMSIEAIKNQEILLFWDFGLNPTCIMAQFSPRGGVNIYASLVGINIGMSQLIDNFVKPTLFDLFRWHPHDYRHIADQAGNTREQSDMSTAWEMIQSKLPGPIEPAVDWPLSRECVKMALNRVNGASRWVQIDPRCKSLIRALRGGWHYKKLPSGVIVRDKPVKDINSHPGDAFSGGLGIASGDYYAISQNRGRKKPRPRQGRPAGDIQSCLAR